MCRQQGVSPPPPPAIEFSEFLQRRVGGADYVVVKMDIGGAEHYVVPDLLSSGAALLIDELFIA
eukprot:gene6332-3470_t